MYVTHQWFQRVVAAALLVIMIGSSVALDVFAATGVDRYTALLVHGNGTDASTTFTDSSFRGASATTVGNAQVDTAQSKFGGASMLFDGSGDYVRFADSDLWYFANDDFTIDFWFRVTSASAEYTLFDHSQNPTNGPYFNLSKLSSSLHLYWYYAGTHCNKTSNTVSWAANTWYHVALVRYNGTVTMYVDGSSVGTTTGCPNYNDTSTFEIGGSGYVADFSGWIDEFRISKGNARWTSNFTPPTGAYGPDGRVTTFLTSGTSWTVPSDWNSSRNTIEVIGGGGGGGNNISGASNHGGGGGAYSRTVNASLTPGGTVTYAVGAGGSAQVTGGDTYFCNSTSNCASISGSAVVAGAKGGVHGISGPCGTGGAASSGVGTVKYSGGDGACRPSTSVAGGGGGAGGPNGAGVAGGATTAAYGGRGGGGVGGAGGAGGTTASAGGNGDEWGFGMGSGGGGGGAVNDSHGGAGGSYGGGAGGAAGSGKSGGTGGSGVIVITYFPSTAPGLVINASKFLSNLDIRGNLGKGSGTFVIDHPQYPATKLLYHSFVESPDVKNLYDGLAKLDKNGEATIKLPHYFEALNKDFRYQFFPIDEAMPNLHIKKEVESNQFIIGGGVAGGEVSWQVTGTRHDPYILANPINVEVEKGPGTLKNKGECLYEPACQQ